MSAIQSLNADSIEAWDRKRRKQGQVVERGRAAFVQEGRDHSEHRRLQSRLICPGARHCRTQANLGTRRICFQKDPERDQLARMVSVYKEEWPLTLRRQDLHAFLIDNYFLLTRDEEHGKHIVVSRVGVSPND